MFGILVYVAVRYEFSFAVARRDCGASTTC